MRVTVTDALDRVIVSLSTVSDISTLLTTFEHIPALRDGVASTHSLTAPVAESSHRNVVEVVKSRVVVESGDARRGDERYVAESRIVSGTQSVVRSIPTRLHTDDVSL